MMLGTTPSGLAPGPNPMPLSTESLLRLEQDFEALNQRIARLATHLGYTLPNEDSVEAALHQVSQQIQNGQAPAHALHLWQEFRGLLVLRYQMETRSVEALGAPQLQAVLQTAQDHLRQRGIAPDQDGVHLDELFGPSDSTHAAPRQPLWRKSPLLCPMMPPASAPSHSPLAAALPEP